MIPGCSSEEKPQRTYGSALRFRPKEPDLLGLTAHRAVAPDAEGREDGEEDGYPDQGEQDRVVGREAAGRVGVRVAPEVTGGCGQRADRIPLRNRP